MQIPELNAIRTIFNNYKNLGASDLQAFNRELTDKMDKLVEELQSKLELKELLSEEVRKLREDVAQLAESLELVEVELIRSKQETKKVKKNIDKLKSLDVSRIKIDVSESDKIRKGKNLSKIFLLKLLTRIVQLNDDGKFLLHDKSTEENQLKISQLNMNISKESNSENVWEAINQCSRFDAEWKSLF